jgi:Glyoxalase-like domain
MPDDLPGPLPRLAALSVDCADPGALADFWLALLGGEALFRSPGTVLIRVPGGVALALQRVDGYKPTDWPGSPLLHLDLDAAGDLDGTVARALAAGAVLAAFQPDPRWRVLLDPAGHPFCLTTMVPSDLPQA